MYITSRICKFQLILKTYQSRRQLSFCKRLGFKNRLFNFCKMDSEMEDDILYYSHDKLKQMIREKNDANLAFTEYLKSLNYPPIRDFTNGLEWFNVSEPLSFHKHLKGKIVVLDFFTYCCINCMHILPDLKEIEQEFSVEDGLVVIGVHSAKFENEKISSNILSAVQRYNISHPVVNDLNSEMWKNCDINCWPTLLILGPNANPIVMLMGEGHKENLRKYIGNSLAYYKSRKEISSHKIPFKPASHLLANVKGPLLFPGKITNIFDGNEEILAISDSGNHRVLITKTDGTIVHEIGGIKSGFKDGNFDTAEFNSPQGLAFRNKDTLFVADTENNAIRRVDFKNKIVETVAGNGVQGNDRTGGKLWRAQEISSPWDLCLYRTPNMDMTFYPNGDPPLQDVLIIAMAGTHQIWALFLDDVIWWKGKKYEAGTCVCIAGSGREENRNNQYPHNAGFAQPSGLALCCEKKELYIADSESSSVRRLSLVDGKVTPVVGGDRNPNNLFAFGDEDGSLYEAKLQHLLGLAISRDEKTLFVADTYNHKLKKVDISKNTVTSLTGTDSTDGKNIALNEPAGLCVSFDGKQIYLADTNNHQIKQIKLDSDLSVTRIDIMEVNTVDRSRWPVIIADGVELHHEKANVKINLKIVLVDGVQFQITAAQSWQVNLLNKSWSCNPSKGNDLEKIETVISTSNFIEGEDSSVEFFFDLICCTHETCILKKFIAQLRFNHSENGEKDATVSKRIIVGARSLKIDNH